MNAPPTEWMTVKDGAEFIGYTRQNVFLLIQKGRLEARRNGKIWEVSSKSLVQFKIYDHVTCVAPTALKKWRSRKQISPGFSSNQGMANWYSNRRKDNPVDTAPELYTPEQAALHMQISFAVWAGWMRPRDPSLQDDLVQEMSLAVLQEKNSATRAYFAARAQSRAINYLKYERVRGMLSLDQIREPQEWNEAEAIDFEHDLLKLVNCGVPREWIEEVLGAKLGEVG